jgi:hypothetical protein
MSPRAACRLERLGFERVYDYVDGISDWKAAGLPVEGSAPVVPMVGDAARGDVPTCTADERLHDVQRRTTDAGWDQCIVLDCDRVVVGRLGESAFAADPSTPIDAVMEPGPATVRPDSLLEPLLGRMARRNVEVVVVTTPQGRLLGALRRADGEQYAGGVAAERIWRYCEGCPGVWRVATKPG